MRVRAGCDDGLGWPLEQLQDEVKRTMLTEHSSQGKEAGSNIVAG